MAERLVDTHAHLDWKDFNTDLEETIARASAAGVDTIIAVGTDLESSRKSLEISSRYAGS